MSAKLPIPARAMILAAGFGSRLGELSDQRPKPMLPVCGTPLVRWCVLWLRHHGVREIVINLHHKGELIEHELGNGSALGVTISYSHEETILGTGGGLRKARPLLDDGSGAPIVVLNGKLVCDVDLPRLLAFHAEHQSEATMVLRRDTEDVWGAGFATDAKHRIVRFLDRTAPLTDSTESSLMTASDLMFTGIHVLSPTFLDRIPETGSPCIVRTAYTELFETGGRLLGYLHDGYWWEHSTIERYLAGVRNMLDERVELPFAEHMLHGVHTSARVDPSARITAPVWIGPNAVVRANAVVGPHAQIGADAQVDSDATVTRSVVWPGAHARGSCSDTVVTA